MLTASLMIIVSFFHPSYSFLLKENYIAVTFILYDTILNDQIENYYLMLLLKIKAYWKFIFCDNLKNLVSEKF